MLISLDSVKVPATKAAPRIVIVQLNVMLYAMHPRQPMITEENVALKFKAIVGGCWNSLRWRTEIGFAAYLRLRFAAVWDISVWNFQLLSRYIMPCTHFCFGLSRHKILSAERWLTATHNIPLLVFGRHKLVGKMKGVWLVTFLRLVRCHHMWRRTRLTEAVHILISGPSYIPYLRPFHLYPRENLGYIVSFRVICLYSIFCIRT